MSDVTSDSLDDDMTAGQSSNSAVKKSLSGSINPLKAGDMVNVVGATYEGKAGRITKFTDKKDKACVQLLKDGQPVMGNPKRILLENLVKTSGSTFQVGERVQILVNSPNTHHGKYGTIKIITKTSNGGIHSVKARVIYEGGNGKTTLVDVGDIVRVASGGSGTKTPSPKKKAAPSKKKAAKKKTVPEQEEGETNEALMEQDGKEATADALIAQLFALGLTQDDITRKLANERGGSGGSGKKKPPKKKASKTKASKKEVAPEEEGEKKEHDDDDKRRRAYIKNMIVEDVNTHSMSDIVGMEAVKSTLKAKILYPIKCPEQFINKKTGKKEKSKGGVLLCGPPGCGKTELAQAVASQIPGVTFFLADGGEIAQSYIGEGSKMLKALFAMAKEHAPSIVFIDEINGILPANPGKDNNESLLVLNSFLTGMTAITRMEESVVVIGATNNPESIKDAALGRFSSRIYVPLPNSDERLQLFKLFAKEAQYECELSKKELKQLVKNTHGYSGRDLSNLFGEAVSTLRNKICYIIIKNEENGTNLATPPEVIRMNNLCPNGRMIIKPLTSPEQIREYRLRAGSACTNSIREGSPEYEGVLSSPSSKEASKEVRQPAPVASPLAAAAQKMSLEPTTSNPPTTPKKVMAKSNKTSPKIATPEQVDIIQAWHDATCERNETELANVGQKPNHHCTQNKVAKDSFETYRAANHPEFPKLHSKTKLYAFLDGIYGKAYKRSGGRFWYKYLVLND